MRMEISKVKSTTQKKLQATTDREKNSGIYITYHGPLSQESVNGIY